MSKSYESKPRINGSHHEIYASLLRQFPLDNDHRSQLKLRGLDSQSLVNTGYVSKPANNTRLARDAIKYLGNNFNLDGVPGFYIDDKGHRNMLGTSGLVIPVRNVEGKISSLSIRTNNPQKSLTGKIVGKYMIFSTPSKTNGGGAVNTTHCPIIKGRAKDVCRVTARITEGHLKADAATLLGDIYCFGMNGLNIPDDLESVLEELEVSTVHIALDAGEDDNIDMLRCKASLIKRIEKAGHDYVVETWDAELGKGIDDILNSKSAGKIKVASQDEIEDILHLARLVDPFNGEWVLSVEEQKMVHVETGWMLGKQQFADKFRMIKAENVSICASEGKIKLVDRTSYAPGKGSFFDENGAHCVNLWHGPGIVPVKGDVTTFLDHVAYIFPDTLDQRIFLDFIAFCAQYPGEKIHWMIVILGKQGIGKSYFTHVLKGIFGYKNVSLPSNEQIHEKYSGWQKSSQIVVIEELLDDGRHELTNKLKPMITQPDTVIREMNREGYIYANRFNLIAFSNRENALKLEEDDRRFCVLASDALPKSDSYYTKLWEWTDDAHSVSALLDYFKTRDITHFNPKARPPVTAAKQKMIELSLGPFEEWVRDNLENRSYPFQKDVAPLRHLKDNAPNNWGERKSTSEWTRVLRKYGAIPYEQQVVISQRKYKCWLFGEKMQILKHLKPSEIAKLYEADPLAENAYDPTDMIARDKPF